MSDEIIEVVLTRDPFGGLSLQNGAPMLEDPATGRLVGHHRGSSRQVGERLALEVNRERRG